MFSVLRIIIDKTIVSQLRWIIQNVRPDGFLPEFRSLTLERWLLILFPLTDQYAVGMWKNRVK